METWRDMFPPHSLDVVSNGTKMWLVCVCRFSGPMTRITSFYFFNFLIELNWRRLIFHICFTTNQTGKIGRFIDLYREIYRNLNQCYWFWLRSWVPIFSCLNLQLNKMLKYIANSLFSPIQLKRLLTLCAGEFNVQMLKDLLRWTRVALCSLFCSSFLEQRLAGSGWV